MVGLRGTALERQQQFLPGACLRVDGYEQSVSGQEQMASGCVAEA